MSCSNFDHDQTFWIHDFGPRGQIANVKVNLTHGFQPGGSIGAVILSDQTCAMNIYDTHGNYLLNIDIKVGNGLIACTKLDGKWVGSEEAAKNGIGKGVRSSIVVVYETSGYRIFVNGKEEIFYKHRSTDPPTIVEITNCQVYKVIYHTSMAIVP